MTAAKHRKNLAMVVASHRGKMGRFRIDPVLGTLGWISTAVMAAATIAMLYVSFA